MVKSEFGIVRVFNFWPDSPEPIKINRLIYCKRKGGEFVNFDGGVYKINRDSEGPYIDRKTPVDNPCWL